MNRTSCTVGIVVVFLLSGILPLTQLSLNAAAQEPADMNDNPILDEFGEVPMDTIVADAGGYILFSHTTNEIEINESEYHVFYFDVNQNMLGSSAVITLDIVDKLFH